jgi:hypothetical protein
LLDALRGGTDLTVASQILPRRKGILCLRRDHTTKIIGESGLKLGLATLLSRRLPPRTRWLPV